MTIKYTLTITDATKEEILSLLGSNAAITFAEVETEVPSLVDVSGEIDAEGLYWDERIHSSSKKKKANGVWNRRKNLDELTYNRIKNELLSANPAPSAAYNTPVQPVINTPINVGPLTEIAANPAPVNFPAFNAPVSAPAITAPVQNTIQTVLERLQAGMMAGRIDNNYISALVNRVNTTMPPNLQAVAITDFTNNQNAIDYCVHFLALDGN